MNSAVTSVNDNVFNERYRRQFESRYLPWDIQIAGQSIFGNDNRTCFHQNNPRWASTLYADRPDRSKE